jgi:FkbM family methyltransferase
MMSINQFFKKSIYFGFYALLRFITIFYRYKPEDRYYSDTYFKILAKIGYNFSYRMFSHTIYYDPCASAIGHRIYFDGSYERDELHAITKYINNDSIILDVGANIGTHSVFFSHLAKNGKVFAFEPSRSTYRLLLQNVIGIPNIIPLNIGLSDRTMEIDFYECKDNALSGLKHTKRSRISAISKILVVTADTFVKLFSIPTVDFVKIDVEGLEQAVLDGMNGVLMKYHPVIFCEIYKGVNSNAAPLDTIQNLISLGYKSFVLDQFGLQPFSGIHDDTKCNYLFLPVSMI